MPKKRYKPEEIVSRLRQAKVLFGQGLSVADAIRHPSGSARSPTAGGARRRMGRAEIRFAASSSSAPRPRASGRSAASWRWPPSGFR